MEPLALALARGLGQATKDAKVVVKLHALKPTNAERGKAVVVLEMFERMNDVEALDYLASPDSSEEVPVKDKRRLAARCSNRSTSRSRPMADGSRSTNA